MKKFSVILGVSFLFFIAFLLFSGLKQAKKPNVLIVLIDTLRADHLGYMGYERDTSPFIDSFAASNLVFKYGKSTSAWTPPSIASLFSGMYASVHGHMPLRSQTEYGKRFTKLDNSFVTLAEVFKENGYATAAISANPLVGERYGLSQGFDLFVSPGRERAEKVNWRARKYISEMWDRQKPLFLYLHYMEPHDPYEPPAPYDSMFSGELKSRSYPQEQSNLINLYDGEIRYVDSKIEKIFAWLKEQGLYEDMIILLVSDHGEQFMERGYQGHADRTYSEEIHIPFILKARSLQGIEETPVSLVDAYPTLLDLAGISVEHKIHGYSLVSAIQKRKKEGIYSEIIRHVNEKSYLRWDGYKLINEYIMQRGVVLTPDLLTADPEMISSQVFNIFNDPFEINPIKDEQLHAELSRSFLDLYAEHLGHKGDYKTSEIELDDKALEQLKTLGYL